MNLGKVEVADSWHSRALGLMFRKGQELPLVFELGGETSIGASIHCCFMRFPIDILFLDKEKRIVDAAFNVRPWTLHVAPRKAAAYVVEFHAGRLGKPEIGEKVDWE